MNDQQYQQLEERVVRGKEWIEQVKQQGAYWTAQTAPYIRVWFELTDSLLREDIRRTQEAGTYGREEKHSRAWLDMKVREREQEAKRGRRKKTE